MAKSKKQPVDKPARPKKDKPEVKTEPTLAPVGQAWQRGESVPLAKDTSE